MKLACVLVTQPWQFRKSQFPVIFAACICMGLLAACSGSSENNSVPTVDNPSGGQGNALDVELPVSLDDSALLNNTLANAWYEAGDESLDEVQPHTSTRGAAKNIIVFVGDGMGISTLTAARILEGQLRSESGEENRLSLDQLPFAGLLKTYTVDAQTADSAGTMTAIMSGVKTDSGLLGVDQDGVFGDCSTQAGNELVSALELAEMAGLATGIISTARITHASPAAAYAKSVQRGWEDDASIPLAEQNQGCMDIAQQLINFESRLEAQHSNLDVDGLEVVMGGGRRHFLPANSAANSSEVTSGTEGRRADGKNLIQQWQSMYSDGVYIADQSGFDALDSSVSAPVLGLFNPGHMQYETNRANDVGGEPSLSQMTAKAIEILQQDTDGFFLTVESGRIDHAHHAGSAYGALTETIEFAKAVQVAMQATDPANTLIIATADHSHVFSIGGIAKRGNPILGKSVEIGTNAPVLDNAGLPYTTLAYANGRGFRNFGDNTNYDRTYTVEVDAGRKDLSAVDTTSSGFHQEILVPLSTEAHGGEDVSVHASGPGASLVTGTLEQNVVFHIIDFAGNLSGKADAILNSTTGSNVD